MTKDEAERFLRARYKDQAWKYPLLREQISEALYVRRNLRRAMELDAESAWTLVGKNLD